MKKTLLIVTLLATAASAQTVPPLEPQSRESAPIASAPEKNPADGAIIPAIPKMAPCPRMTRYKASSAKNLPLPATRRNTSTAAATCPTKTTPTRHTRDCVASPKRQLAPNSRAKRLPTASWIGAPPSPWALTAKRKSCGNAAATPTSAAMTSSRWKMATAWTAAAGNARAGRTNSPAKTATNMASLLATKGRKFFKRV